MSISQDKPAVGERRADGITIATCTFRRPQLSQTLHSLSELKLPEGYAVDIVVVDNDHEPSAEYLVREASKGLSTPIRYVHAPAANISVARNACLDQAGGRYLAFIDDDEIATPSWLVELLNKATKTKAHVVLGPVRALYEADAPAWMSRGDFHSTHPIYVGGEILTGYTCNALLDLSSEAFEGLRFDPARGRSGGEDTAFFHEVTTRGGRIVFAPHAEVLEAVPHDRATMAWLSKRRYRMGQTHGEILGQDKGFATRTLQAGLAASKFAACLILAVRHAGNPVERQRNRLRATLHAGAVGGIFGARQQALYGDGSPRSDRPHAA